MSSVLEEMKRIRRSIWRGIDAPHATLEEAIEARKAAAQLIDQAPTEDERLMVLDLINSLAQVEAILTPARKQREMWEEDRKRNLNQP